LSELPYLQQTLALVECPEYLNQLASLISQFPKLVELLSGAIIDNPPMLIRDGGVIAPGYNAQLDELRELAAGASRYLEALEKREIERTGIHTLKVGFNRIHGYFIEVSRSYADQVPSEYVRRQTLKNNERYIIPELKEYEDKVLSSKEQALALEKRLYDALFDQVLPILQPLMDSATACAELDVLNNFAERADTHHYFKPELTNNSGIEYRNGRHPVVEAMMQDPFIANPLTFNDSRQMLIITGPNMGGKSTYMRQTALIVIMANIGSFVPAEQAVIGTIDAIYTRIGASDDLASGRSTFMVEMTETANILHNATRNSLVLMDEIGRGTSTYDGLSLAWASADYLAKQIGAYTLFATHYFELTQLADEVAELANIHLGAVEHDNGVHFMHKVEEGAANKSYGLQVAQLAGVPQSVIQTAKTKLKLLEKSENNRPQVHSQQPQSISENTVDPVRQALSALDPDDFTPRQALEVLYKLRSMLK
jgi:DNA mismatch repair protein MutS